MSEFGEQFVRRVDAQLEAKGAAGARCPICEGTKWATDQDTIALLNHLGDDIDLKRGMSTIAVICKNCGFTRLHSALHLFDEL